MRNENKYSLIPSFVWGGGGGGGVGRSEDKGGSKRQGRSGKTYPLLLVI